MPEEDKNKKRHWRQRFNYAAESIESSLSIKVFIFASILEVINLVFKVKKTLIEAGYINEKVGNGWEVLFLIIVCFFMWAMFSIAEESGVRKERISQLEQEAAEKESEYCKQLKSHAETYASLHSVIHKTRDRLLAGGGFRGLLALENNGHIKYLYETIESQLGMMEKAFQSLTGNQCSVVLKIKQIEPGTNRVEFVSVCYGPTTPIGRRENSTPLPADQGIVHEVVTSKKIAACNDVKTDPRFWPKEHSAFYAENRYQTIVACPVIMDKVVCGVLCFDWKEPNMYCKSHDNILACFTDIVSLACYVCTSPEM